MKFCRQYRRQRWILWVVGQCILFSILRSTESPGGIKKQTSTLVDRHNQAITITIRVVDLETNAAVAGTEVTALDGNNKPILATPDKSGLEFSLSVEAGTSLTVQAQAPGYMPTKTRLPNILSPQKVAIQLAKLKPSVLSIKVFDTRIGQPLMSATATITSQKTGKVEQVAVTNGRAERSFTTPDNVTVLVGATGFLSAGRQLAVEVTPAGNKYEFDAVLEHTNYYVSVRAVDKDTGQDIPGIQFRISRPGNVPPVMIKPDPATGVASTSLAGVGTYQITSIADGYDDFSQVWVVEKEQSDVFFQLKARPVPADKKLIVTPPSAVTQNTMDTKPAAVTALTAAPKPKPVDKPPVETKPSVSTAATSNKPVPAPTVAVSKLPSRTVPAPPAVTTLPPTPAASPFGGVEKGKVVRLNNIYFDQSSPVLRPESHTELDQLYAVLTQDPLLRIEIRGHTDNQGDFDLNTKLSRDRCQAVIDYLVGKGIRKERLKAVGRGPIDAIAPNNNEENRRKNRRVEFVVL